MLIPSRFLQYTHRKRLLLVHLLYTEEKLKAWVDLFAGSPNRQDRVHVLMNSCYGDYGVRNARQLAELLARIPVLGRALETEASDAAHPIKHVPFFRLDIKAAGLRTAFQLKEADRHFPVREKRWWSCFFRRSGLPMIKSSGGIIQPAS